MYSIEQLVILFASAVPTVVLLVSAVADRRYGLFSPFLPMLVLYTIVIFCRATLYVNGFDFDRPELDFGGTDAPELVMTSLTISLFLFVFSLGYFTITARQKTTSVSLNKFTIKPLAFLVVTVCISFVSIGAIFLYLRATGGDLFSLETMSGKRRLDKFGARATGVQYLVVIDLALAAIYVMAATWWKAPLARRKLTMLLSLATAVLVYSIYGFAASSRRSVLYAVIPIISILHFEGRITWRQILIAGGVFFLLSNIILLFRTGENPSQLSMQETARRVVSFESFADSRDGPEISKMTNIIGHFSETGRYRYGMTYVEAIYSLIPRVFWPDKPNFSIGYYVTEEVYKLEPGKGTGGQTPSVMGELFINFGWVGILLGGFLVGVCCGQFMKSFFPTSDSSLLQTTFFLFFWPSIGYYLHLNGIGAVIQYVVKGILPLFLTYLVYCQFAIRRIK